MQSLSIVFALIAIGAIIDRQHLSRNGFKVDIIIAFMFILALVYALFTIFQ